MKVITLTQPWATLVAIGAKHFETRSWKTNYRGPLAIHAAKGFPSDAKLLCWKNPFNKYLRDFDLPDDMPRGQIIAVVTLADCLRAESIEPLLGAEEIAFGNYSPGRFAWRLTNPQKLIKPIPAKGALGLWEFPDEKILHVATSLETPHA